MVLGTSEVYYSDVESPVGNLLIASTVDGLCKISFGGEEEFHTWLEESFPKSVFKHYSAANSKYESALRSYFSGDLTEFDLDLNIKAGGFQKTALQELAKVPHGKTISYGELAVLAGSPRAARAAGTACARNPIPIVIPCHRVLASGGGIGGFGGRIDIKRFLLRLEGVDI
jgi:methylated-DNA-[protein]-cysteine S-methyltransferase